MYIDLGWVTVYCGGVMSQVVEVCKSIPIMYIMLRVNYIMPAGFQMVGPGNSTISCIGSIAPAIHHVVEG